MSGATAADEGRAEAVAPKPLNRNFFVLKILRLLLTITCAHAGMVVVYLATSAFYVTEDLVQTVVVPMLPLRTGFLLVYLLSLALVTRRPILASIVVASTISLEAYLRTHFLDLPSAHWEIVALFWAMVPAVARYGRNVNSRLSPGDHPQRRGPRLPFYPRALISGPIFLVIAGLTISVASEYSHLHPRPTTSRELAAGVGVADQDLATFDTVINIPNSGEGNRTTVHLLATGEIVFDYDGDLRRVQRDDLAALRAELNGLASSMSRKDEMPDESIDIRVHRDVSYGSVESFFGICSSVGIWRFGFIAMAEDDHKLTRICVFAPRLDQDIDEVTFSVVGDPRDGRHRLNDELVESIVEARTTFVEMLSGPSHRFESVRLKALETVRWADALSLVLATIPNDPEQRYTAFEWRRGFVCWLP